MVGSLQKKLYICNAICVAEKFCNAQCVAENAMQKTGLQIFCNASQRYVAKICNAMCVADFKKIRNAIRNVRCRLPKILQSATHFGALQIYLQRNMCCRHDLQRTCTNSNPLQIYLHFFKYCSHIGCFPIQFLQYNHLQQNQPSTN